MSFSQFGEVRESLPFCTVPVLEVDGVAISQSNAISRYVGKMSELYPEDATQAMYCDEVLEAVEDLNHYIVVYLKGLDQLLVRGGGKYFAGDSLSLADLKVFVQVRALASGNLDHVPTDLVATVTPALLEHHERIALEPGVVAYYESRGKG